MHFLKCTGIPMPVPPQSRQRNPKVPPHTPAGTNGRTRAPEWHRQVISLALSYQDFLLSPARHVHKRRRMQHSNPDNRHEGHRTARSFREKVPKPSKLLVNRGLSTLCVYCDTCLGKRPWQAFNDLQQQPQPLPPNPTTPTSAPRSS
jgi:hypothetical protein